MRSVAPENQSDGEESPQDEFILTDIMDVFETPVQNEKAFPMQDANQA